MQFPPFPCGTQFTIDQKKNLSLGGGTPLYSAKLLSQAYFQNYKQAY